MPYPSLTQSSKRQLLSLYFSSVLVQMMKKFWNSKHWFSLPQKGPAVGFGNAECEGMFMALQHKWFHHLMPRKGCDWINPQDFSLPRITCPAASIHYKCWEYLVLEDEALYSACIVPSLCCTISHCKFPENLLQCDILRALSSTRMLAANEAILFFSSPSPATPIPGGTVFMLLVSKCQQKIIHCMNYNSLKLGVNPRGKVYHQ